MTDYYQSDAGYVAHPHPNQNQQYAFEIPPQNNEETDNKVDFLKFQVESFKCFYTMSWITFVILCCITILSLFGLISQLISPRGGHSFPEEVVTAFFVIISAISLFSTWTAYSTIKAYNNKDTLKMAGLQMIYCFNAVIWTILCIMAGLSDFMFLAITLMFPILNCYFAVSCRRLEKIFKELQQC